jgi:16S rRNA (adenine1518-N6/adenine1519-N6)-dimethyltransferase
MVNDGERNTKVTARSLARASLERLARFEVRPNRELGQHFLVDDNVLEVIGRTAALAAGDVVLEIGGGLGVLSEYLAQRSAHVHVIETDARLEPVLADALAAYTNTSVLLADVMDVDLAALRPAPDKVVANLPYGVAVPAIILTIAELEGVSLWCLMVQREIADRLRAKPGTKAYGIPSVIVQLSCRVEFVRAISRNVFHPPPNVDSALVRLHRRAVAPAPAVRALVHAAFAHRRKTLAGSLELALPAASRNGAHELREAARAALEQVGHRPDERAERLEPEEFVGLAQRLERWL